MTACPDPYVLYPDFLGCCWHPCSASSYLLDAGTVSLLCYGMIQHLEARLLEVSLRADTNLEIQWWGGTKHASQLLLLQPFTLSLKNGVLLKDFKEIASVTHSKSAWIRFLLGQIACLCSGVTMTNLRFWSFFPTYLSKRREKNKPQHPSQATIRNVLKMHFIFYQ